MDDGPVDPRGQGGRVGSVIGRPDVGGSLLHTVGWDLRWDLRWDLGWERTGSTVRSEKSETGAA